LVNGRDLASLLFLSFVALLLFPALIANAASYGGDITETIAISDTVQYHKYSPLAEAATLSEVLVVRKFTPRLENIPISETLSVTVYRLNRADASASLSLSELLVVRKFTPRLENIPISETLSVTVYRLNRVDVSASLSLSEVLSAVAQGVYDITVSEALTVNDQVSFGKTREPPKPSEPSEPTPSKVRKRVHIAITENLTISEASDERKKQQAQVSEELSLYEEERVIKRPQGPPIELLLKVIGGILVASILGLVILTLLKRRGKGSPRPT